MPEAGPFGETFFEASARATVSALLVKSPGGGCVESEVTPATHRLAVLVFVRRVFAISASPLRCVSRGHGSAGLNHFRRNVFCFFKVILESGQGLRSKGLHGSVSS